MMINEKILKNSESAVYKLRSLYKKYGYRSFKMSKFEEYDLYSKNKDFLQGNGVITFSDTGGELLALKPDVTLSIIKNTTDKAGTVSKLYYDENVYRISGATKRFKEIMQTGIECIGDLDNYSVFEVIYLAAKSLSLISERFVLDISHMGIVKEIIASLTDDKAFANELTELLAEKNSHEAKAKLAARGIPECDYQDLISLMSMHGTPTEVVKMLEPLCKSLPAKEALSSLREISLLMEETEFAKKVRIDFSVINNMSYYNGIVLKGFIDGIPEGVLSGGSYGALMKRMKRDADAIGFAIYLDMLEELASMAEYDVDVLLIYKAGTPAKEVICAVNEIMASGKSVAAQTEMPELIRYKEIIRL